MIDWQQVLVLKEEVGEDDFGEVVEMFLEEVEEVLADLGTDTEPSALEASLHALKSSALNLGFSGFADLCASGEKAAGRGEAVDLAAIRSMYADSRAVFDASRP
ncbi:MAG: Hpt domain-containing protein [Pseudomonadota bacterium]|nr:Hpt domain-containing protein [Pseudomonadota bacterium]